MRPGKRMVIVNGPRGAEEADIVEDTGSETYCPASPYRNRKHVIDTDSLHVDWDGDTAYIDVNCLYCGRSGCVGMLTPGVEEGQFKVDW